MTNLEVLIAQIAGLQRDDVERWIAYEWVRPEIHAGHFMFHDIDVARIRLIRELRDELQIGEDAMPVILSLLDQVYSLRRRVRELTGATNQQHE